MITNALPVKFYNFQVAQFADLIETLSIWAMDIENFMHNMR